jgi:hypothetical protein
MAFCFAVSGGTIWHIWRAESHIVSCNHSRADFELILRMYRPDNKPRTEG